MPKTMRDPKSPSIHRLHTMIGSVATERGFTKSGPVWTKQSPESLILIHPQRSQWGDRYSIEVGTDFFPPARPKHPGSHVADVRIGLERLVSEDIRNKLAEALNFENEMDDSLRGAVISRTLLEYGFPFLERFATCDGIRQDQGKIAGVAVRIDRLGRL